MSDFWGDRAGPGLKARIQGVDPRPTSGDVEEAARNVLREGKDPYPGGHTATDCPECGKTVVTGRETYGEDRDSLREVVEFAREICSGYLSEEEFEELAREEFDAVLQDLREEDEDGLNAEVHRDLDEFSE